MADTYIQGSFAFRCTVAEADLMAEALGALDAITQDKQPELPSETMLEIFAPTRADEPWSGLIDMMSDRAVPAISTDFSRQQAPDDPEIAIVCFSSSDDFEPIPIAELIQGCCQTSLASAPVGFEWAVTCSRPRIDEFGGGWCAVFADRIEYENTGRALDRALDHGRDSSRGSGVGWQVIHKR